MHDSELANEVRLLRQQARELHTAIAWAGLIGGYLIGGWHGFAFCVACWACSMAIERW